MFILTFSQGSFSQQPYWTSHTSTRPPIHVSSTGTFGPNRWWCESNMSSLPFLDFQVARALCGSWARSLPEISGRNGPFSDLERTIRKVPPLSHLAGRFSGTSYHLANPSHFGLPRLPFWTSLRRLPSSALPPCSVRVIPSPPVQEAAAAWRSVVTHGLQIRNLRRMVPHRRGLSLLFVLRTEGIQSGSRRAFWGSVRLDP